MICIFQSEDFPLRRLTAHVRSVPSGLQRYNQLFSPLHNTKALPSFPPLRTTASQKSVCSRRRTQRGRRSSSETRLTTPGSLASPSRRTPSSSTLGCEYKCMLEWTLHWKKKKNFADNLLTLWLYFIRSENGSYCFYPLSCSGGWSTHIPSSRACRVSWRLAGTPTPPPGEWNRPTWDRYIRSKS